eukprot:488319-Rhodomonas_salina.10
MLPSGGYQRRVSAPKEGGDYRAIVTPGSTILPHQYCCAYHDIVLECVSRYASTQHWCAYYDMPRPQQTSGSNTPPQY